MFRAAGLGLDAMKIKDRMRAFLGLFWSTNVVTLRPGRSDAATNFINNGGGTDRRFRFTPFTDTALCIRRRVDAEAKPRFA